MSETNRIEYKRELTSELDIVGKFFYFTRRWLTKLY